ncbi:MAG: bacteriocin immunity protein [Actinomycetes bacterium]
MEHDRVVALVRRIKSGDYATVEEADSFLVEFTSLVPDPQASDLIFHPDVHPLGRGLSDDELTPERIVELARQYRPIAL